MKSRHHSDQWTLACTVHTGNKSKIDPPGGHSWRQLHFNMGHATDDDGDDGDGGGGDNDD